VDLGDLAIQQERYDEGRRLLEEARSLYDKLGDGLGEINGLSGLSDLAVGAGSLRRRAAVTGRGAWLV